MSESWKNRLWSLVFVFTFAVVLSVCQNGTNSTSDSSSSIAYADFVPSDITYVVSCGTSIFSTADTNTGAKVFVNCNTTDSISVGDVVSGTTTRYSAITLADLASA